jgi:hypothetical protein
VSPKAKGQDRKPQWRADLALVVCKGGPRAGAWYFRDHGYASWVSQVAQTKAMHHKGGTQPALGSDSWLGYVETTNTVDHPRFDGPDGVPLTGTILLWNPAEAAARERRNRETPPPDRH